MRARWPRATSVLLCAALLAGPACGEESLPPEIEAWIGSPPDDAVKLGVRGDLSGRGTRDWAGVVRPASFDAKADPLGGWQVVVFLQQPDGHYRLAVHSKPFSFDCGSSWCSLKDLRIERHSLFVEWLSHWHAIFESGTYQFQPRDGAWPLIGMVKDTSDDPDDGGPSSQETISHNRLTGDVVVSCTMGGKPPRVRRSRIVAPRLDLADFALFHTDLDVDFPGRCHPH